MFVAYTGHGRIAILGEEIRSPARNIPRAILATLIIAMILYASVVVISVGVIGAFALFEATRKGSELLKVMAEDFAVSWIGRLVTGALLRLWPACCSIYCLARRVSFFPWGAGEICRIG